MHPSGDIVIDVDGKILKFNPLCLTGEDDDGTGMDIMCVIDCVLNLLVCE